MRTSDKSIISLWGGVARSIQLYWFENVERFFNRSDLYPQGRFTKPQKHNTLQGALDVSYNPNIGSITCSILPQVHKHVNILMKGAASSPGAFVPFLGIRSKYGIWKGITSLYWATWESNLHAHVELLVMESAGRYGASHVTHQRRNTRVDFTDANRNIRGRINRSHRRNLL